MRKWSERSNEVAYLLNPAFCGRLLYNAIRTYNVEAKRAFPFPLIYLILPLVLHKNTREKISSRTQLLVWIQKFEYLLIGFPKRAKQLVPITNESIEILLQSNLITISSAGELEFNAKKQALSKTRFTDDEIKECITKSEHIAKWFAKAGKAETIYVSLGVRP
jgi:hypothetical protein